MKKESDKQGLYTSNGIDWPMPIEMECKINCMKNSIQQIFANSIAADVCGTCNVHCYRCGLHLVPFNKVPSVELLKTHNGLNSAIPQIQKMEGSLSSNKISWNNDVGAALTGDDKEKGRFFNISIKNDIKLCITDRWAIFYGYSVVYLCTERSFL